MKFTVILVLLVLAWQGMAAFDLTGMDVFTGGNPASSRAGENSVGFMWNPAASSGASFQIGISYFKPFNFSVLNDASLVANFPGWKGWSTGLMVGSFGNTLYREATVGFNVSRAFWNGVLQVGLNVKNYYLKIKKYGSAAAFGIDVGLRYSPWHPLTFSMVVGNINQPALNGYQHEIPTEMNLGMVVRISNQVVFTGVVQKEERFPVNVLVGFDFRINSHFFLQSGFQSYPGVPSLGVVFQQRNVRLHYALQYHFQLGETHLWGISFGGGNDRH